MSRVLNHLPGLARSYLSTLRLLQSLVRSLRRRDNPDLEVTLDTEDLLAEHVWTRTTGVESRSGPHPGTGRRTPLAALDIVRHELLYIWRYIRDLHLTLGSGSLPIIEHNASNQQAENNQQAP